jgi:hypothetical protein
LISRFQKNDSIDIIKSEPVTAAIMHPDVGVRANTRRAAYNGCNPAFIWMGC